ncbi:MAG: Nramp family divalent metal transporter [Cyanobacteria bacterium NC_groundwater_1444_Ag_S-0.65um_54_12]|nr:Nramp family divalent metal transporter [Cyanobacteria bacterium NC_groundwater_1444_Ag_S-0.65um_54_12]
MPATGKLSPEQDTESLITIRFNKRRWLLLLGTIGPGLVTANADNDAGGIATYATAGATYGYSLLWVLLLITFVLAMVQEMVARMGAVTGKGLSSLIRERFGVKMTGVAMLALLIANIATIIAEFAGIAAASEILGISKYLAVPGAAIFVWWLVVKGTYEKVEKALIGLSILFLTYVLAGLLVQPNWGQVFHGLLVPQLPSRPSGVMLHSHISGYLLILIAMIGTTITPWMQFFLQSSVVDKGITTRTYSYARFDVLFGAFVTNFVAFFIIVATAGALYYPQQQPHHISDAADAARALAPIAGHYAELLFALGLFGASLLAASVVPLATSYAICEAFGWQTGVSKEFKEAPVFLGLYTCLIALGALVVLWPQLPLLFVLLLAQDINGILLPIILIFMLRLVNDSRLMGRYVNGPVYNVIAWGLAIALIAMTATLLVTSLLNA